MLSMQVVVTGRRKHYYSVDIAAGAVTRIPNLKHVPDKSLESFTVCPDSQVRSCFTAAPLQLHCGCTTPRVVKKLKHRVPQLTGALLLH